MDKPKISDIKVSFFQDSDTLQDQSIGQDIEVQAASPDGHGFYFILSSNRWAVESSEEIAELINRVKQMTEL